MKKTKEKSISKLIQEICSVSKQRTRPKQVFDDLIQVLFNIVVSPQFQLFADPDVLLEVDEKLIVELTSYKNDPKAWELLQQAANEFFKLIANNEPFSDVLGDMYDEYLGEVLGQFLTPSDLALALAHLTLALTPAFTEETLMSDPCGCGGGSLMLAQLRTINQLHGKQSLRHIVMIGMDIDPKMVQLSTIQILANCLFHKLPIKGLVMHWGNVITEYDCRADGTSTLAVKWIPRHFQLAKEYQALEKLMTKIKNNNELEMNHE